VGSRFRGRRVRMSGRDAERTALLNLAQHLREAVFDIPAESKLARTFGRYGSRFAAQADAYPGSAEYGGNGLASLERDLNEDNHARAAVHLEAARACLSRSDALYGALDRVLALWEA
jgi:hypothetical protein